MGAPHIQNGMPEAEVTRLVSNAIDFELGQGEASGLTWAGRTEKLNQIGAAHGIPPIRAMERGGSVRAKLNAIMDALDVPDGASLYLDFLRGRYYGGPLSFVRETGGSYFDANGVLRWAAANELRYDHDPMTGVARGALVEEQRTNLVWPSNDFTHSRWNKLRGTIVPNAALGPDGQMSASLFVEDASNNSHQLLQHISTGEGIESWPYTIIKRHPGGRRYVRCWTSGFGNQTVRSEGVFDLDTGSFVSTTGAGSHARDVKALGDGWYRIALRVVPNATNNVGLAISLLGSQHMADETYQGDGVSAIQIFAGHWEVGSSPGSYIPTTTAAVTRAADVFRVDPGDWLSPENRGAIFVKARFGAPGNANTNNSLPHIIFMGTTGAPSGEVYRGIRVAQPDALMAQIGNSGTYNQVTQMRALQIGEVFRTALAGDGSDTVATVNGEEPRALPGSNDWGSQPTTMFIGSQGGNTRFWNGHVEEVVYLPRRPSNAEIRARTAL